MSNITAIAIATYIVSLLVSRELIRRLYMPGGALAMLRPTVAVLFLSVAPGLNTVTAITALVIYTTESIGRSELVRRWSQRFFGM